MSSTNNRWRLTKTVLPQHTDHAGVMWHGSYLNFLEEGRIEALEKVGYSYSELSKKVSKSKFFQFNLDIKYLLFMAKRFF